eukprot:7527723-Prorocentrum_lima.AAC.1
MRLPGSPPGPSRLPALPAAPSPPLLWPEASFAPASGPEVGPPRLGRRPRAPFSCGGRGWRLFCLPRGVG